MADIDYRALARDKSIYFGFSLEDQIKTLNIWLRTDEITEQQLLVASRLGHDAAIEITGDEPGLTMLACPKAMQALTSLHGTYEPAMRIAHAASVYLFGSFGQTSNREVLEIQKRLMFKAIRVLHDLFVYQSFERLGFVLPSTGQWRRFSQEEYEHLLVARQLFIASYSLGSRGVSMTQTQPSSRMREITRVLDLSNSALQGFATLPSTRVALTGQVRAHLLPWSLGIADPIALHYKSLCEEK